MKLAFLLLVLLNVVLFAWQQGVFGQPVERGREPERVARQIEPERVRVLTERDVQVLRERARQQGSAGPDLNAAQACLEFGDFPPTDAPRAEKALLAVVPAARLTVRTLEAPGGYLVFVPPMKTRAEVDRRADELRELGVKDMQVIGDNGPLKFAIGLGSFRDAEAAKAHLGALEKLGVKGARVSDKPTPASVTRFQLRELDAGVVKQLAPLRAEFPGHQLRACPAG
jgi:hypothetical protein